MLTTFIEKINILFFLIGISLALYFYIVFSPKLAKYFVYFDMVEYINISKINVLHLSIIFVLPHIIVFSLIKLIFPIQFSLSFYIFIFILVQALVVFPTFNNLYKLGNWKSFVNPYYGLELNTWGSPLSLLQFSLGILYPIVFIGYFLFIRIFFLGKTINMNVLFELKYDLIPIIILILCYIPIFYWLLKKIVLIKKILWLNWEANMEVLNLILVQNDLCFNFIFHLKKIFYFIWNFMVYYQPSPPPKVMTISLLISKYLRVILDYSWIAPITLLVFPIIEILLTKQLYYFQYYLFFYILIKNIWFLASEYGTNMFAWCCQVSLSDYLYKNYKNPHFPLNYVDYYKHDLEYIYNKVGFCWVFTEEEQREITEAYNKIKGKHSILGINLPMERRIYIKKRFYKNSFLRKTLYSFGKETGRKYNFIYNKKIYKYN